MRKTQNMDLLAPLVILLMLPATIKASEVSGADVKFWKETVTLTCPASGEWFKKGLKITESTEGKTYEFPYNIKGTYHCEYSGYDKTEKYYFYVQGKTCENCFELDGTLLTAILAIDMVATVVFMVIVYKCTKGKSSAKPAQPARAPASSGGRGPPVPSPDYEQLSPHTRALDTYSMVNRTG